MCDHVAISLSTYYDKLRKLILFLSLIVLFGCSTTRKLPKTDIVFQIHPADPDTEADLGFINADGTDYVTMLWVIGYGMLPVWSPDSAQIVYRQSNPLYRFDYYGKVAFVGLGEGCPNLGGNGRVRWIPNSTIALTTVAEQQNLGEYLYRIVGIDPQLCEIVGDELYTKVTSGFIRDPDLSTLKLLAFTIGTLAAPTSQNYEYSITVVDLDTNEEWSVGEGVVPSWSPDGEWLAYTGYDGIYIVLADGTEKRQVVEYCTYCQVTPSGNTWNDWPPLPEWSPDGNWLVYHREVHGTFGIYKFNLETGEELLIVEDGLNPYWRLNPP